MNLSQKERNTIAFIVFCLESILYLMVLWQIIFWLLEIPVFRQGILDYGWMPGNFVGRELAVAFSEESLFRLLPMVVIYTLGLNRILAIKLVVVSLTAGAFAYVHGILYLPSYASAGLMLSVLFFEVESFWKEKTLPIRLLISYLAVVSTHLCWNILVHLINFLT